MQKKLLLIFLLVLCACSAKPYVVKSQKTFSGTGSNEIYIVSHGWHTGFIVPAKAIQIKIPELKSRFTRSQYIEFGWGDKKFYQAKEKTSGLAMRAAFWPTESVVHVAPSSKKSYQFVPDIEVEMLCLTDSELLSLVDFIANSFYQDSKGEVLTLKTKGYGYSQFYKGAGDYSLMNTCNNWTAKGLRSIGMNIFTGFKFTADSVMSHVRAVNQTLGHKGRLCE